MQRLTREEALERLERHGIAGADVYLIDLIPLIEMMWADGFVQQPERDLFRRFARDHVASINELAGLEVLSPERTERFASKFLDSRPDDALMGELRDLVPPARLSSSDEVGNDARRQAIVEWCLDIGAACVTDYPYGSRERFKDAEKARFFSILRALTAPA